MRRTAGMLWLVWAAYACGSERRDTKAATDTLPGPAAAPPAQAAAGAGQGGAYDCHHDPSLQRPAAVATADTLGLGAAIVAGFTGYRLSTEAEIACRFPLTDGSTPATYWPAWGSGSAWWIWRGDFDGDGRTDRLVLLTEAADPSKDLLVVLHANGTAARVAPLGGWGVDVLDAQAARERGVPANVTNAIAVVYWEKASDLFYWNGSAYVLLDQ